MRLFEFLRDFSDVVKDSRDDWRKNVTPAFRELGEMSTDGFKEMVLKKNSNYQTSYEKMDTANAIIDSATEKHEKMSKNVKDYYLKTDKLVKEHYQFKQTLHNEILKKHHMIIDDFIKLKIDHQSLEHTSSSNIVNKMHGVLTGSSVPSAFVGTAMMTSGLSLFARLNPALFTISLAGWFIEKNKRVAAADKHLENAQMFHAKVNVSIAEMQALKSRLKLIRASVLEEKQLITSLLVKLEAITNKLCHLMKNGEVTTEDAQYGHASVLIANAINDTLTTTFLTETGELTSKYKNVLQNLKDVQQQLNERGI